MEKTPFEEDLEYIAGYSLPYELLNKKTVFITGGTGLIGYQLVKSLLAIGEMKIIVLVRNIDKVNKIYTDEDKEKIKFIKGDILEPIRIKEKIDYIFHCAAVTTSKIMIEKPVETLMTAVTGTNNVLELAKEKKCKSVVFVSSMEMYGSFSESDKEVTEDMIGYINPLKVRSNYPESKRLCENMCIAYMEEFSVPVKIARLAQTFGAGILPWENRVFAQFAKSVINQQDIVLHTKGLSEGNYCYTRDCVIGLLTLLLKGVNGEAYNIANPESHTTISEMANMVADKIADKKIKVLFDIPESNLFGYAADTKMKLNSDKLQKLGWKPEIGLEEAYKRMIASMLQNKSESESRI